MRGTSELLLSALMVACTAIPTQAPKADRVWTDVSAGRHVSCAVDDAHSIKCWGDNSPQPPDTGWVDAEEDEPTETEGLLDVELQVMGYGSYGSGSACALRTDHSVVCWGEPTEVPPTDVRLTALVMSHWGPCGVTQEGAGACWADGSGDPGWPAPSGLTQVRGSEWIACFVDEGGAGQCGYVTDGDHEGDPTWAVRDGPFSLLVPASYDICGIRLDGTLECWDRYDETLDGSLTPPTEGAPYQDFCWSGGGLGWGCALDADNHLHCFGGYDSDPRWQWDVFPDDTPLVSISCGAFHVCGLTAEGAIRCYGDDTYDQLDAPR